MRRVHKQLGITLGRAQTHLAIPATAGCIGEFLDQLGEIGATAGPFCRQLGLGLKTCKLFGTGVFRNGHQDLRQVDFQRGGASATAFLLAQKLVDLLLANFGPGIQFALTHAVQHNLIAQVGAKLGKHQAFGRQAPAQFVGRHLVLPGHVEHGIVHHAFADLHAGFLGKLQLGPLHNDALQQQARQLIPGGTCAPCCSICCSVRNRRARTSLLVIGSELTTATM